MKFIFEDIEEAEAIVRWGCATLDIAYGAVGKDIPTDAVIAEFRSLTRRVHGNRPEGVTDVKYVMRAVCDRASEIISGGGQ